MKELTRIEMANDKEIYEFGFGNEIKIINTDNGFTVIPSDCDIADAKYCDEFVFYQDAIQNALAHAIDEHLVVTGYGKYSGQKFWQLPEGLQERVKSAVMES